MFDERVFCKIANDLVHVRLVDFLVVGINCGTISDMNAYVNENTIADMEGDIGITFRYLDRFLVTTEVGQAVRFALLENVEIFARRIVIDQAQRVLKRSGLRIHVWDFFTSAMFGGVPQSRSRLYGMIAKESARLDIQWWDRMRKVAQFPQS